MICLIAFPSVMYICKIGRREAYRRLMLILNNQRSGRWEMCPAMKSEGIWVNHVGDTQPMDSPSQVRFGDSSLKLRVKNILHNVGVAVGGIPHPVKGKRDGTFSKKKKRKRPPRREFSGSCSLRRRLPR